VARRGRQAAALDAPDEYGHAGDAVHVISYLKLQMMPRNTGLCYELVEATVRHPSTQELQ
jgi:hypothetical protein